MESRNRGIQKLRRGWMTACDFLTGGQARTDFYRWLSRRIYGRETRVIKTRGGDHFVTCCRECPLCPVLDDIDNMAPHHKCMDRDFIFAPGLLTKSKNRKDYLDPACELHFRTPVFFQILPVILAYIGTLAIILTACLLYWKYR